jgi:hypothetical protein
MAAPFTPFEYASLWGECTRAGRDDVLVPAVGSEDASDGSGWLAIRPYGVICLSAAALRVSYRLALGTFRTHLRAATRVRLVDYPYDGSHSRTKLQQVLVTCIDAEHPCREPRLPPNQRQASIARL